MAGAEVLQRWFDIPIWVTSLVVMVLLTLTNLASVRSSGEFEFWFASIKVAAIIAFIRLGAAYVLGLTGGEGGVGNLTAEGGFAPEGIGMVLTGVVIVIFAFVGAEIATIAAAESDQPREAVTRATVHAQRSTCLRSRRTANTSLRAAPIASRRPASARAACASSGSTTSTRACCATRWPRPGAARPRVRSKSGRRGCSGW